MNDLERPVGTYLLGRRMYATMAVWDGLPGGEDASAAVRDYAEIWKGMDKVVYSRTLQEVSTKRTRIEPEFDPEAVRGLKASADADLSVGGPELAAQALRAGLVDEIRLFLVPVLVGGGKRALPDGIRVDLELLDEHRFDDGTIFLRYRCG